MNRRSFCDFPVENRFLDFTIKVGDEEIRTNKALLLRESPVLKSMCAGTSEHLIVDLPSVSNQTIKLFLDVLIGEVDILDVSLSNFCELVMCLDKLCCEQFLIHISKRFDYYWDGDIAPQNMLTRDVESIGKLCDTISSHAGWHVLHNLLKYFYCRFSYNQIHAPW